jgi:hypothetical protein
MYCENCDCEWSATHGGERCDFCGQKGRSGYYPETAKDRAAFIDSGARWREIHFVNDSPSAPAVAR